MYFKLRIFQDEPSKWLGWTIANSFQNMYIITTRIRSMGKVMFSLESVILFMGGGASVPQCNGGI